MKRALVIFSVAVFLSAVVFSFGWSQPPQSTSNKSSVDIPEGVILIWSGTNAAIPAGWTRETALDGLFPKGWGAQNPNMTGGAATHTHSGGSHGHTANAHNHTASFGNSNSSHKDAVIESGKTACNNHDHAARTLNNSSGGDAQSTAVSWSAVSNNPPYYSTIFIKSSGTSAELADEIIALWAGFEGSSSIPANWAACDGTNSTPDLKNKYIVGAAAGANAGTTGGSTTNNHSVTHSHTANAHSHTCPNTGTPTNTGTIRDNAPNTNYASSTHTHTVSIANATVSVNSYTNTTAGSADTVEPAYKKTTAVQKKSGGVKQPGIIGMWLGSTANIPAGWKLCDGTDGTPDLRDRFIKIGASTAEIGNTGGSNTHAHAAISHSHTSPSHAHTGSTGGGQTSNKMDGGGGNCCIVHVAHTHVVTVSSTAATFANNNITCDSVSNEPPYRTVVYIQYTNAPPTSFSLLSPSDEVATQDTTPEFAWEASSDPEGSPITYTLQISDNPQFSPVYRTVSDLSATSYAPPAGQEIADGTYYWKVIASDGEEVTESNEVRQLTIDTQLPATPTITKMLADVQSGKFEQLRGTGETGASLTFYRWNGTAFVTVPGSYAWDGNVFTFDSAAALDSGAMVYVTSSDAANNTTTSRIWTIACEAYADVSQDCTITHSGSGCSMRLGMDTRYRFKLAVNAGQQVTISAWLRRNYTDTAPSITMSGLGVSGAGTTATMSGPANTWQQLTVVGTPTSAGVLTLTVQTTATAEGAAAWIDDVSVSQ